MLSPAIDNHYACYISFHADCLTEWARHFECSAFSKDSPPFTVFWSH
jgi:hypothetical protein